MNILQVNKFHYPRGGADIYYLELGKALEKAGHNVAYFSMLHPKNQSSEYSKYFVSRLSFNEGSLKDKLKTPGRMIYSLEAKRKFKKLIEDFKPDIIHIHNIYHQISPSILDVAARYKIPVVMHLHDYKLVCPNYQLFAHGKICEDCKPTKYYKCVKNRCFKNSCTKSTLAALEMYIHHSILKIHKKNISSFIAPSLFMKNKVAEFGWDENKIKVIYNPYSASLTANEDEKNRIEKDNYLLYFGRLSKEKGLSVLIRAAKISNHKLKLVGLGSEKKNLEKLAEEVGADVEFLGFKSGQELKDIIMKARAVVIPSIWSENMPLSLLEALNLGAVVLASNIGGLPEIIEPGKNGWLFQAGDVDDLVNKINNLDTSDLSMISNNASESVKHLTMGSNWRNVEEIYSQLLNTKLKRYN
jgi:glycosyltransferase involved in cell wall biosynthesis